jgi:hypothetical protein
MSIYAPVTRDTDILVTTTIYCEYVDERLVKSTVLAPDALTVVIKSYTAEPAVAETHAVPLLVKMFPEAPGDDKPVPPLAAASVPDKSLVGTVAEAVNAEVPLPLT